MFSFPVTCQNGEYSIVQRLSIDAASQTYIDKTRQELEEERDAIAHLV
jgi:malate dehydrogenase